jgi:hypothetical protein
MLVFGFVKIIGTVSHTDGKGEVPCLWVALRTKGMIIPAGCQMLAIPADEKGNLRFVFTTTNFVESRLKNFSRKFVAAYDANEFPCRLESMEAWVYFPQVFRAAFIVAYNEEGAAKAAYEAGLRATPAQWHKLAYEEHLQTKKPGDIPGE